MSERGVLRRALRGSLWVVPIILFVLLAWYTLATANTSSAGIQFYDDDAYAHLAVGQTLATHGTYGIMEDVNVPASRDVLWRLAVGGLNYITHNPVWVSVLLGLTFAFLTVLQMMRLSRLLYTARGFILSSTLFLLVSPTLFYDAVSGLPTTLNTFLVTGAILYYIEGHMGRKNVLPMRAALLIGFAMWNRLEFGLLWPVFVIHSLCARGSEANISTSVSAKILRGFSGLAVLLLVLFPVICWNLWLLTVPWPRMPGMELGFETWQQGVGAVLPLYFTSVGSTILVAYQSLFQMPTLGFWFSAILVLIGVIILVTQWKSHVQSRSYTLALFLVVLVPLFVALQYPISGEGGEALVQALNPFMLVIMTYGCFRLPPKLVWLLHGKVNGLNTSRMVHYSVTSLAVVLFVVLGIRGASSQKRVHPLISQQQQMRSELETIINDKGVLESVVVTDQAGWLAYQGYNSLIDLNGEFSPGILLCVGEGGVLNRELLLPFLSSQRPSGMIVQRKEHAEWPGLLATEKTQIPFTNAVGFTPEIYHLTWPVAP